MIRQLKDFTEALILAVFIFLILQSSVQNFKVEGSSMVPSINPEEYVTINKLKYIKIDMARFSRLIPFWDASHTGEVFPFRPGGPQRGEIVVFRYPQDPSRNFVKRIIGLPGEKVSIINGVTHIDGDRLREPYLRVRPRNENAEYLRLGKDEYFVMGDNRPYSNDSRHWDENFAVPLENITGSKWLNYNLPVDLGFARPAD